MPNRIYTAIFVALAYFVSARMGFLWSLLPDQITTIIWPASGVALAAVLVYGRPALVGIFLGALLAFGPEALAQNSPWALLSSMLIAGAVASASQVAAYGLRTTTAIARRWDKATDLLKGYLTVAIASTIPAAATALILLPTRQLSWENLPAYFPIWWIANFLGVLIFAPLGWLLIQYCRGRHKRKIWSDVFAPLSLSSLSGVIALTAFLLLWHRETESIATQLNRGATIAADGVSQALDRAARNLGSIRALVYASDEVLEEEFRRFTETDMGPHLAAPGVQAVGWAPKVTKPDTWFAQFSETGTIKRQIWERDSVGKPVLVGKRSEYFPVQFIQPTNEVNQRAIAFDLASEKSRRAALERSRDTGEASIASPIILVQSNQPVPALLMSVPIYQPEAELDSTAARRNNLTGFATGVYLIRDIFLNTVIEENTGVDFHLFDESLPPARQWFHSRITSNKRGADSAARSAAVLRANLHGAASLEFAGHTWTVITTPGPDMFADSRSWTPWGAMVLLMVLGLLASSISIERLTAEKRSREEQQKTEQALAQAQAANESKAYFMAAASHDIKQPLYALGMLTDTLIMSGNRESSGTILERLRESINHIAAHFDALMDIEMFRDGNFETRLTTVRLAEFSSRIDLEFAPMCKQKGIQWTLAMEDVAISTDSELLLRLMRNLLANAIRHTDEGEVACRAIAMGSTVNFEISDTGSGIDLAEQQIIAHKLQNPDSRNPRETGSGLGLSIVAKIAQALHLELRMSSQPGTGTTFQFQIAVTQPQVSAPKMAV